MTERAVYIRLGVKDADAAAAALRKLGSEGEAVAARLERAAATGAEKLNKVADGAKRTAYQQQQLMLQLNDVGVTLAGGMSPLQVLVQQGPQITQIYGGLGNTFRALIGAVNPATAALVLFGGGMVAAMMRADDLADESRQLGVALRSVGRDAEVSVGQLQAYIRQVERQGVARDQARQVVTSLARQPVVRPGIGEVASVSPDAAVALNTDTVSAGKAVAAAFSEGYGAVRKLDEQLNFLTRTQAANVRQLYEQGKASEAAKLAFDAFSGRVKGLNDDSLSPAAKAFKDMGQAWSDFADSIANSRLVIGAVQLLASALQGIADTVKGAPPPTLDARRTALEVERDQLQNQLDRLNQSTKGYQSQSAEVTIPGFGFGSPEAFRAQLQAQIDYVGGELGKLQEEAAKTGQAVVGLGVGGQAGGQPASAQEQQLKVVDDMTQSYRDQQRILAASIPDRARVRAEIAAEHEATEKGLEGKAREELIRRRVGEALAVEADARGQESAALGRAERGNLAYAAAAEQSAAAGIVARAQMQAGEDAATKYGVSIGTLAAALVNKAAAEEAARGGDLVRGMREQAEAAERLAAAEKDGPRAVAEAERLERVRETVKSLEAARDATTDPEIRTALEGQIRQVRELSEREARATAARKAASLERQQTADLAVSALEQQLALETDPAREQALKLQIQGLRDQLAISQQLAGASDDLVRAATERAAKLAEARAYTDFLNDVRNKAKEVSQDVTDFLVDGFVNAEKGGKSAFEGLWDGALAGAKRFAYRAAAEILQQQFILPIAYQVVGGIPGAFGLSAPASGGAAGAAGQAGGLSGGSFLQAGQLANIGYSQTLANAGSWFATSQLGGALGLSTTVAPSAATSAVLQANLQAVNPGVTFAADAAAKSATTTSVTSAGSAVIDGLGYSPWGIIGSLGANALGLVKYPGVGSMVGGAVGGIGGAIGGAALGAGGTILGMQAGSILGPVGAVVGAFLGTILGGLIGSKPSNFGAGAVIDTNSGKVNTWEDKSNDEVRGARDQLSTAIVALSTGMKNAGATNLKQLTFGIGQRDQWEVKVGDQTLRSPMGDTSAFLGNAAKLLAETATGFGQDVQTAIKHIDWSDIEKAVKQLDFAATFQDQIDALNGDLGLEDQARKQAKAEVKTLTDGLKEFKATTAELGLNTAAADAATKKYVEGLVGLREAAKPLNDVAAAVETAKAYWGEMGPLLDAVGIGASKAADGLAKALAKIRDSVSAEFDTAINEASGKGYLNTAKGYVEAYQTNVERLGAAGLDASKATALLQSQFRTLFGQLDADQVADVSKALEGLTGAAADLARKAVAEAQKTASETAKAAKLAADRADAQTAVDQARSAYVDALQRESSTLAEAQQRFKSLAATLRETAAALRLDNTLSPLSASDQLAEARTAYRETKAKAEAGDQDALDQLSTVARRFLELSRTFNADQSAYVDDFNDVQGTLDRTARLAEKEADAAGRQLEVMQSQLTQLGGINNGMTDLATAMKAYAAAAAAAAKLDVSTPGSAAGLSAAADYLLNNSDVAKAAAQAARSKGLSGSALLAEAERFAGQHYSEFGQYEGREFGTGAGTAARVAAYLANNPDIKSWAEQTARGQGLAGAALDAAVAKLAEQHWLEFGQFEGRKFAAGGFIRGGEVGLVGEAGRPEFVMGPAYVANPDVTRALMGYPANDRGQAAALRQLGQDFGQASAEGAAAMRDGLVSLAGEIRRLRRDVEMLARKG